MLPRATLVTTLLFRLLFLPLSLSLFVCFLHSLLQSWLCQVHFLNHCQASFLLFLSSFSLPVQALLSRFLSLSSKLGLVFRSTLR